MHVAPKIPVLAALGLSFTGCDPAGPTAAPDDEMEPVAGPDALVGEWRSLVTYAAMYDLPMSTEVETVMTVGEDLAAEVKVTIRYDAPGAEYDETYGYVLPAEVEALGAANYRISVADVDDAGKLGSVMRCTLTGDALACEFTEPGFTDLQFERQD